MSDGNLTSDPLFVGLTRPTLIFGVSISYAMLNMIISVVYFINTSSFWIVPVAGVIHVIGYILCFKEPRFMELYLNKLSKCNNCPNKSYFGSNSYYV
ncbi:MAG: virB3 [Rickettsiaceae bacterium]|jgi:type IV secretion system protein VirB3|nr:virB3 [Rickettsiaceae bacterium]